MKHEKGNEQTILSAANPLSATKDAKRRDRRKKRNPPLSDENDASSDPKVTAEGDVTYKPSLVKCLPRVKCVQAYLKFASLASHTPASFPRQSVSKASVEEYEDSLSQ